jgi:hypothetical protein
MSPEPMSTDIEKFVDAADLLDGIVFVGSGSGAGAPSRNDSRGYVTSRWREFSASFETALRASSG